MELSLSSELLRIDKEHKQCFVGRCLGQAEMLRLSREVNDATLIDVNETLYVHRGSLEKVRKLY